jgi:MATE family multidrug resistance protein
MTLLTFTAYALDGFAYAVEAHSGQAYGARESGQLQDVWRAACRQSGLVALAFAWFTPASVSRLLRCLPLSLRCASWRATISSGKSSYRWWASGVICWTACLLVRRAGGNA